MAWSKKYGIKNEKTIENAGRINERRNKERERWKKRRNNEWMV